MGNVIDKPPKRLQPKAKRTILEVLCSDTKKQAGAAMDAFEAEFSYKHEKGGSLPPQGPSGAAGHVRSPSGALEAREDHERDWIRVRHSTSATTDD
jgi:hypothetical protein